MNVRLRAVLAGVCIWGGTQLGDVEGFTILSMVILGTGGWHLGVLTAIAEGL